jgi:hypothetical protein
MTGKRRWRKSWEEKWRDEASDDLGLAAKALRALLGDVAELVEGSDVGWAVDANGRAYTRPRLARLLSATDEQVDQAIDQLLAAGVAVLLDGRLGLVNYRTTQEDPSAKRVREHRAKQGAGVTPPVTVTPDVTPPSDDGNDQKTEDRGQSPIVVSAGERASAVPPPPCAPTAEQAAATPSTFGQVLEQARRRMPGMTADRAARRALEVGAGIRVSPEDLRRWEADQGLPSRAQLNVLRKVYSDPPELAALEVPDQDPDVARKVVAAHHERAVALGLAPAGSPPPPIDAAALRWVFAPREWEGEQFLANWLICIPRKAQQVKRERGRGRAAEFFTLRALSRPDERRLLLDTPDYDRDLDQAKERAPGGWQRGGGGRRPTGPAPPVNEDLDNPM